MRSSSAYPGILPFLMAAAASLLMVSSALATTYTVTDLGALPGGYSYPTGINELGHVLFISKDNLDSPWRDSACPTGYYRSICHVPGDFLNEGEVSVTYGIATLGASVIQHASERDAVTFKVSDRMDPGGVRGNYPLQWRRDGVRPRMKWTVAREK